MLVTVLAMSDVLLTVVGSLLVALVAGGFSVFVNRPSKVAAKAADILSLAYESQKNTIKKQGTELLRAHRRIDGLEESKAECHERVDKLRTWVEKLGGDVDEINRVGKQGPPGDKGETGDKGAHG